MRSFRAMIERVRAWRAAGRRRAEARRRLASVFARPDLLRGTSLRPEHRARAVLLDVEADGDRIVALGFGIVRHPRPHAFSRQFHEVLELYRIDLDAGTPPERVRGVNLSRARGTDGEPSSGPRM